MKRTTGCLAVVVVVTAAGGAAADEGMWLLNKLPRALFKQRYGFEPDEAWVQHVQMSCVRIGGGGSGSFVSADGLVMTNHHVASDAIADLSDERHDYVRDGFYARTHEEELKCPQMELTVLVSIEEITDRVNAGATATMSPAEAMAERKRAMAAIEKEARERTGLVPEVVTLYQGARYDLYLYRRYTDVRLVMAPEHQIAFFGGDLDNFEYPRYNLDVCFLRAYEAGRPARVEHCLRWSAQGPAEGEAIFVAGHPARTQRLHTVDHLRFLRDVHLPLLLSCYNQREVTLLQFSAAGAEPARIAKEDLLYIQNGRKAYGGIIEGLLDARLFAQKSRDEEDLRAFVAGDPNREKEYGGAWEALSAALDRSRGYYREYFMLENRRVVLCRLYDLARKLVRAAQEREKPDGDRLSEYREANLPSLELDLFSPAPIHDELERVKLADGLVRLGRILGGEHPVVKTALGGTDAATRAATLVSGTKLRDVAVRRKLYEGGTEAVARCDDPMIRFARDLDRLAREVRKRYEDEYESVEKEAYAKIARARFARYGETVYPDATFTLRLSDGTVRGYRDGEKSVPAMTTFRGAYERAERHGHQMPYQLPRRWIERKSRLNLDTPFNFISTNDIIGGNSGSPMFNKAGEVTGLVFDGNIHGLIWDFQFDMTRGRAVGVHSQAIVEALEKMYDARPLVEELRGRRPVASR